MRDWSRKLDVLIRADLARYTHSQAGETRARRRTAGTRRIVLQAPYGRKLGMAALEREISRARHATGRLVLAFTDVDKLKQLNDSQGHAAGDALLREVVVAMQAHLRAHDPVVRVGGDKFVCALGDCTIADARRRFDEIQATVRHTRPGASISVGLAPLCSGDTLQQLIAAADAALYEVKHAGPSAAPGVDAPSSDQ